MKKIRWSDEEIDILEKYYATRNKDELLKLLPRSWESVLHRASRLGTARTSVKAYLREQRIGKLSHDEAVYVAGMFDGEGTFTIYIKGCIITSGNGVTPPLRPIISLVNTSQPLIKWLRPRLGNCTLKKPHTKTRKAVYILQIARLMDIKTLLEQISPYLIVKKKQAELLLEFCNLRLQGKWREYNPRLWEIAKEIRKLNRRGNST